MWLQHSGCRLHRHASNRLAVRLQPKQQLSRPAIVSTEVCQNCKSTSFYSHLRGERECKREKENYKQTETARHGEKEWKRDSAAEGGLANALAFKLQISNRLPDIERERQCTRIISANTNIGNGSKMEFTQAHCCTVNCQENTRPKSGGPEWQHGGGGGEWGCRFLIESKAIRNRLGQAGRLHAGEWPSAASARLNGEITRRNCRTMNMKLKGNGKGVVLLCLWECVGDNYQSSLSCGEQRSCRRWLSAAQHPLWLWWWGPPPVSSTLAQRQSRHLLHLKSHTEPPLLHPPCTMVEILNVDGTKWSPFAGH